MSFNQLNLDKHTRRQEQGMVKTELANSTIWNYM